MQPGITDTGLRLNNLSIRCPINNLGFGLFGLGIFLSYGGSCGYRARGINSKDDVEKNLTASQWKIQEYLRDRFFADTEPATENERKNGLINIWHPTGIHEGFPVGTALKIGWTHFETDHLSDIEIDHLSQLDGIIICSEWAKGVLIENFNRRNKRLPKVHIVPGPALSTCIDSRGVTTDYNYAFETVKGIKDKFHTNVLISSGKWEIRKNHPDIIKVINNTRLPIHLIGLWDNPFTGGTTEPIKFLMDNEFSLEFCGEVKERQIPVFINKHGARVFVFPRLESVREVIDMYRYSDGYLAVSSGEGWDMPAVEAISLSIPTLITYNTAHMEYTNPHNTFSIPCETVRAYDGRWFHGTGNWYKPSYAVLDEKIREFWKCATFTSSATLLGHNQRQHLLRTCNTISISLGLSNIFNVSK